MHLIERKCTNFAFYKIPLTFVFKVRINNITSLVHIMAWRRPGDKPLSETMMLFVSVGYMRDSASIRSIDQHRGTFPVQSIRSLVSRDTLSYNHRCVVQNMLIIDVSMEVSSLKTLSPEHKDVMLLMAILNVICRKKTPILIQITQKKNEGTIYGSIC